MMSSLNRSQDLLPWRATLARLLVPVYLSLIFGVPSLLLVLGWICLPSNGIRLGLVFFAPLIYSVLFAGVAGILSRPHHRGIIPGRFPRNLAHPVYFHRRLYGLCWTALYYCKPVYFICLNLPALKWLTFRLFGYKGALDFTVYPDTWIRDLPLLDIGSGAYLSNRATIGTNMSLSNGKTLVDRVTVGRGALLGHLAMIAPGVSLGDEAEVGAGAAIGLKAVFEQGSFIGPTAAIDSGVVVGTNASVGSSCYIGKKSTVESGATVPNGLFLGNRKHFLKDRSGSELG